MKPRAARVWSITRLALIWLAAAAVWVPSPATAQPEYVVRPVVEKRLKELPVGPLFWRVERFGTLAEAQAAESQTSLVAEIAGKVWLLTLGQKSNGATAGANAVEIGPLPPIEAVEYLLRINYAGGPPGAKTAVHTHPGSETFYVLTGQLGQKTPHGEMRVGAGQSMAGHAPGMPMEVFSSGSGDLTVLVMFVVDAAKPFSSPAKLE